MIKWLLIILICFSLIDNTFCQGRIDDKYVLVVKYLQSNIELNKELEKIFPFAYNKRKNIIKFKVSPIIRYVGFVGVNEEFHEEHYFESDTIFQLEKLVKNKNSEVCLVFSKPMKDHLIVELLECEDNLMSGGRTDIIIGDKQLGSRARIIFIFNDSGLIEEAKLLFASTVIFKN